MKKKKVNFYTKWVTLGWWASFAILIGEYVVISMFSLIATPIFGWFAFASFLILSLSDQYQKNYVFSPYHGLNKIFNRKNNE